MTVLVDNDIVWKVCACNLVSCLLHGIGDRALKVLPTSRYKFRANKPSSKVLERYGATTHARMCAFIDGAGEIDAVPANTALLGRLNNTSEIDPGESLLFVTAAETSDCHVMTGDKRGLVALSGIRDAAELLSGRIICFEQLLLGLIAINDFAQIRDGALEGASCDTVLRVAFGVGCTRDSAREALESYVTNLRVQTGSLLMSDVDALSMFTK